MMHHQHCNLSKKTTLPIDILSFIKLRLTQCTWHGHGTQTGEVKGNALLTKVFNQ